MNRRILALGGHVVDQQNLKIVPSVPTKYGQSMVNGEVCLRMSFPSFKWSSAVEESIGNPYVIG